MNRRAFVTGLVAVLAAPLAAGAQSDEGTPRIGILHGIRSPVVEAFVEGMRDLGYVEGKNMVLERRSADGTLERLPALATELVRLKVHVIFSPATAGTRAAQRATTTIPIVFAGVADPVGSGFIKTLANPGGNITGLTAQNVELSGKRLALLREAIPHLNQVGILADSDDPAYEGIVKEAADAGGRIGLRVKSLRVKDASTLSQVFAAASADSIQGLLVVGRMFQYRQRIAELAKANRMGAIADSRPYVETGLLMGYGTDYGDLARRAAAYVDKILKGAKPADLPVEQPTKFDLVINLKTAKALGLTIPPSLLLRADQVIE